MAVALAGALLLDVGLLAFLANLVVTLGWANLLGLVVAERRPARLTVAREASPGQS